MFRELRQLLAQSFLSAIVPRTYSGCVDIARLITVVYVTVIGKCQADVIHIAPGLSTLQSGVYKEVSE